MAVRGAEITRVWGGGGLPYGIGGGIQKGPAVAVRLGAGLVARPDSRETRRASPSELASSERARDACGLELNSNIMTS
jgi:hypothetical protein